MMGDFQLASAGFYAWWILLNSLIYFAEFHFLQQFTGFRKKWYMLVYILLNSLLTFLVMYFQSSGMYGFVLHMGVLICFFKALLKLKWIDMIAPVTIIFTLSTFSEGFQTVFMKWFVRQNLEHFMGIIVQIMVSGTLTVLLIMSLYLISKKYIQRVSCNEYLYILLLPCAFIVWVIRSSLGWNMQANVIEKTFFGNQSTLWAFVWMVGACAIFFIILQVFNKIIMLSIQENERTMLADQVREQKIYLQEAKKRNEQYRAFQHDIDNHFLVLSGLLHERKYAEAEDYSDRLRSISDEMIVSIDTGNPVADILLKEKLSFARANGIHVNSNVHFSAEFFIEDMDLCILLANALDNAIQACMKVKKLRPEITIMAGMRHHFLIVEVVNTTASEDGDLDYGTGLKNIKQTVERYEGTMEIDKEQGHFRLSLLLCLKPLTK